MFESCWSTGYPGIFNYTATLRIEDAGDRAVANLHVTYEVERAGSESESYRTSIIRTAKLQDGKLQITVTRPPAWCHESLVEWRLDPADGTFTIAWEGEQAACRDPRTRRSDVLDRTATLTKPWALDCRDTTATGAFDTRAGAFLRAAGLALLPTFHFGTDRTATTTETIDLRGGGTLTQDEFREGSEDRGIAAVLVARVPRQPTETQPARWRREFRLDGLPYPNRLLLRFQIQDSGGPPQPGQVEVHITSDAEGITDVTRVFEEFFPDTAAGADSPSVPEGQR
jgi:hypothetical protein